MSNYNILMTASVHLKWDKKGIFKKIFNLILGRYNYPIYMLLFVIGMALLFTGIIVAIINYPIPFDMWYHQISYLGSYSNNPMYFTIFNSTVKIVAVVIFPAILFLRNQYSKVMNITSSIAALFGVLGTIGFFLIGFFPVDLWTPHWVVAALAFGGVLGQAMTYHLIIIVDYFRKKSYRVKFIFVNFTYLLLYFAWLGFAIFPIGHFMYGFGDSWKVNPRIFYYEIWEWAIFLALLGNLALNLFITSYRYKSH